MADLFWYHQPPTADGDAELARATTAPVIEGGAVDTDAPEFNELVVSEAPLYGLQQRSVSGEDHPAEFHGVQFSGRAEHDYNHVVNESISRKGQAAVREQTRQGQPSIAWVNTIEPVIRDGAQFGNATFLADTNGIQAGQRGDMKPDYQNTNQGSVGTAYDKNSRKSWIQGYASMLGDS